MNSLNKMTFPTKCRSATGEIVNKHDKGTELTHNLSFLTIQCKKQIWQQQIKNNDQNKIKRSCHRPNYNTVDSLIGIGY